MKSLDGRGLLSLALTCALALCLVPGMAAAQDASSPGSMAGETDAPSYLGPKPKPLRRSYVEPAAPPEPSAPRAKAKKSKRSAVAAAPAVAAPTPRPPAKSRAVNQPKTKASKASKTKAPKAFKPARLARPGPKPRPVTVAPAATSLRSVQQALNRAGYPAPVDGKLGKSTRRALRHFQRAHGLPATGQADRPTLIKLGLN
jgi:hypothetical protein